MCCVDVVTILRVRCVSIKRGSIWSSSVIALYLRQLLLQNTSLFRSCWKQLQQLHQRYWTIKCSTTGFHSIRVRLTVKGRLVSISSTVTYAHVLTAARWLPPPSCSYSFCVHPVRSSALLMIFHHSLYQTISPDDKYTMSIVHVALTLTLWQQTLIVTRSTLVTHSSKAVLASRGRWWWTLYRSCHSSLEAANFSSADCVIKFRALLTSADRK